MFIEGAKMGYSTITILRLVSSMFTPVIFSMFFYALEKKTKFKNLSYAVKQVIIGLAFGGIAIWATEFGIPLDGAVLNVRNAAPLTAGLLFGWPAGLISGFVGGIERFFTPTGDYTRIACTVGTIIAGFIGASVRRFMMDNKKASWFYGLLIGIVTEVIHMLMVFLNNSGDIHRAFRVVEICAVPMILATGLSVMFSILVISLLSKRKGDVILDSGKENISQTFQRWLFGCVILAFVITTFSAHAFQKSMAESTTVNTLRANLSDIKRDIQNAANYDLVNLSKHIVYAIPANPTVQELKTLVEKNNLLEINVVNTQNTITTSSNPQKHGEVLSLDQENQMIFPVLNEKGEFIQTRVFTTQDSNSSKKIVGISTNNGFIQIIYDLESFQQQIDEQILHVAQYRHIGQNGFVLICNKDGKVISDTNGNRGKDINLFADKTALNIVPEECFVAEINDVESLCMYTEVDDYYILGAISEEEAYFSKEASVYMLIFMETIVFAVLFAAIFVLIKKLVVRNIRKINSSLSKITDGDLNVTIDVRDNEEFASLSDDINSTVATLKHYIDEAAARLDKDLEIAKQIQHSALPSVFPPYPNRKDFCIYASMNPAKEVGGDFYDFYLVDENQLAFVVADVSGKGIPGAMFMMTSKTLIKSYAESGISVCDVFTQVNTQLCQNNEAGMFVTAWMGILNLKTGVVKYANAGHNPPVLKRKDGSYEYLKGKVNFVLAGLDGIKYKEQELQLQPGDEIYLYTDGVTEAHNSKNELFGEARLLASLNSSKDVSVEEKCKMVKRDVDGFVGEAEQFDDITMLCVRFSMLHPDVSFSIEPSIQNITDVAAFVENELEKMKISHKITTKLLVAVDEIYSNICRYSGATETKVEISKEENALLLRFLDNGKPYNPLDAEEPDITASVEDRAIGGLGIFMVKKMLDKVEYEYKEGRNIITLTKAIE